MSVLRLGDHVDCGSALLENGKIVAAIHDGLVREKMIFGGSLAIDSCNGLS